MQFFARAIALAAAATLFFASAAPLPARQEADGIIPGKYVIQLKPETDIASITAHHVVVREIHARNLAKRDITVAEGKAGVEHEYSFGDFKGYSGTFDATTIEEVKSLPEPRSLEVEQDQTMTATGLVIQNPSSWGLTSISSRTPGASGYVFDNAGTHATFSYVLDTGIRLTHQDFGGRAQFGANYAGDGDNDDANGHGTHVAGIIGGQTFGVAKKTTLIAVKVLGKDGAGATSGILAGINYVASAVSSKGQSGAAVINLSLSGAASSALDNAIANAVSAGIPVAVAAGNENSNASLYSPARAPSAICVASIQSDDTRSSFSNWGADVDIFAPGSEIRSAYIGSDTATATASGTSAAAPHIAGLVSYIRGLEGPSSSAAVRARLLGFAIAGRVKDAQGSPNLVAYNGNGGANILTKS